MTDADTDTDGGGIKGFTSLILLRELVKEIARCERAKDPDAVNSDSSPLFQASFDDEEDAQTQGDIFTDREPEDSYRLCHYFDFVCGTGYGG